MTRRKFGKFAVGAAFGAEYLAKRAYGAGSPFSVALVPDPQYLAAASITCGGTAYNALIQWGITNRNLSVNGAALNIKGFLQVGDCANTVSASVYDAEQTRSATAYALAEAANPKMFVARCIGNHDYAAFSVINRNNVACMWRTDTSGIWSPANVAATYSGGMDLGDGDVAYFGGVYADPTYPVSTANNYMRINIQGRKILIIALEFFPRDAVMTWAKSIHDTYTDHETWILTHGYMRRFGDRFAAGSTFGPAYYSMSPRPDSNSGDQMWTDWMASWSNVTFMGCGHDINGYDTSGGAWVWKRLASTSSSSRAQTVQQIYCDCQENDTNAMCSGTTPDGTSDMAHLMILRITPSTDHLEAFLISTNSGKWTGASGVVQQTDPVQLFDVSFPALAPAPSTAISGTVAVSGTVVMR